MSRIIALKKIPEEVRKEFDINIEPVGGDITRLTLTPRKDGGLDLAKYIEKNVDLITRSVRGNILIVMNNIVFDETKASLISPGNNAVNATSETFHRDHSKTAILETVCLANNQNSLRPVATVFTSSQSLLRIAHEDHAKILKVLRAEIPKEHQKHVDDFAQALNSNHPDFMQNLTLLIYTLAKESNVPAPVHEMLIELTNHLGKEGALYAHTYAPHSAIFFDNRSGGLWHARDPREQAGTEGPLGKFYIGTYLGEERGHMRGLITRS